MSKIHDVNFKKPKNNQLVLAYNNVPNPDFRWIVLWYDATYDKFRGWEDDCDNLRDEDGYYQSVTHWSKLKEPSV